MFAEMRARIARRCTFRAVTAAAAAVVMVVGCSDNNKQIVAFDRRRNHNREALGEMKRKRLVNANKVWFNMGELFIKLPRDDAIKMVETGNKQLPENMLFV